MSELYWTIVKANVTDAGTQFEEPLNEWWSYEHVPEFVARDGFRRAWRLRTVEHPSQIGELGQKYLACYEVETIEDFSRSLALSQPPWGPWQEHIDDWLVDWSRTHYRVLQRADQDDTAGGYFAVVRATLEFESDAQQREFDAWYSEKHLPEICSHEGVHRAWRLETVEHHDVVNPAPHGYWTVYQVDDPDSFAAARDARTAAGIEPWDGIWLPYLEDWGIQYHEIMYHVGHDEAVRIVAELEAKASAPV